MTPKDVKEERILRELTEIRRLVETLKAMEEERSLQEGLFRTLEYEPLMGIFIIQDGKFQFVNRHSQSHWGYNNYELIGKDSLCIVHPEDRERTRQAVIEMLQGRRFTPIIFRGLTKEGKVRWVTETVAPIRYKGKRAVLLNYMDITEQVESQKRLEELEALEASILEAMPHAVVGLRNRRIIFANNGVERVFGWKAEEIIGKSTRVLYRSDEDYEEVAKYIYEMLAQEPAVRLEFPCRKKDGEDIDCAISAARIGEELKEKNIVVIFEDITERKREKDELEKSREELRKLTAHLESVREKERTMIARELHDEIGQLLTAMSTETVLLTRRLPDGNEELASRVASISRLIDITMQALKRIYMSLRPGMLDHLGLASSVLWQAEDFSRRTGIACEMKVKPENLTLEPELSTALFRIFQETLTNIARHADATCVQGALQLKDGRVCLRVKDNGRGITEEEKSKPHSFGLLGIRERVASLGGQLEIRGKKGAGTEIKVTIPVVREKIGEEKG
ncbi:MAG TPA: PAS domain S-box protein [Syntrophales bacterium]|nr:PAS domain S-box protein [Syntrophales bacterium]HOL60058.1 PAS domain S-box protein [Syntrophales bacterium]HPO36168.1 PAS domain S-box protein [Syntrophales bacterium]